MKYRRKYNCSDGGEVTFDSETCILECTRCGKTHSTIKIENLEIDYILIEFNPSARF